jgi:DNA-directed RNA polymerase subunit M/transcription elongation factor TFIIS
MSVRRFAKERGTTPGNGMASANQQLITVSCPGCGAGYEFPAAMAGRRGSCASCGTFFTVPNRSPAAAEKPASLAPSRGTIFDDEQRESPPQYIPVECRVCQTRMYGSPDQVGHELKCPDCGARTKVPPPPTKKPKNIPAAMEGEQYELYEPDMQPLPSALKEAEPKFIAIKCRQCDTLMYATERQVGDIVTCPDCGKKHKVPAPPRPKPVPSVLASDAETPRLDPAAAPPERPPVIIPPRRKLDYEEQQEAEYARAVEESRRTGKPMKIDSRGRPIMPRWPLVTGVWRMLLTEEIISRWILLSLVLGFAGQFLGEALLTPLQGMAEAIKLIFTVIGGVLAAAWLAMAAPLVVAIVGESSDGEDKLHQAPRLLAFDWFGELFSVVTAASLAGLCGLGTWHLARLVQLEPVLSAALVVMVVLIVLPVALLSTLLEGTPLGVLSPRLASSLGRCAGYWLLFYLQSFFLAAVVGGAGWIIWHALGARPGDETTLLWLLSPIAVAAVLIDMRLLGRLAWWLSARMPERAKEEET